MVSEVSTGRRIAETRQTLAWVRRQIAECERNLATARLHVICYELDRERWQSTLEMCTQQADRIKAGEEDLPEIGE